MSSKYLPVPSSEEGANRAYFSAVYGKKEIGGREEGGWLAKKETRISEETGLIITVFKEELVHDFDEGRVCVPIPLEGHLLGGIDHTTVHGDGSTNDLAHDERNVCQNGTKKN